MISKLIISLILLTLNLFRYDMLLPLKKDIGIKDPELEKSKEVLVITNTEDTSHESYGFMIYER